MRSVLVVGLAALLTASFGITGTVATVGMAHGTTAEPAKVPISDSSEAADLQPVPSFTDQMAGVVHTRRNDQDSTDAVNRTPAISIHSPDLRPSNASLDPAGEGWIPITILLANGSDGESNRTAITTAADRRELISNVRSNQTALRDRLERYREGGKVDDIKAFWIHNAIAARATAPTIRNLSDRQDVARILYDYRVMPSSRSAITAAGTYTVVNSGLQRSADHTRLDGSPDPEYAWSVEFIGADRAHRYGLTGAGVNVSVIDSGIDGDHPALVGRISRWRDFTADNCSTPCDPNGHGTHVSGTIAGGLDVRHAVGVAPDVSLFGARVLGASGSGRISDVLAGIEWSANNSADVVSMSLGIPPLMDAFTGRGTDIDPGNVSTTAFSVHETGTALTGDQDTGTEVWSDGFKPAFALVYLDPTHINETDISGDDKRQTEVLRNLSLTLQSPTNQTLERVDGSRLPGGGSGLPDGGTSSWTGVWKVTPKSSQPMALGNWSVVVRNDHGDDVSFDVSVRAIYPTNGSDLIAKAANDLARNHGIVPVLAAGNSGALGNRSLISPGAAARAVTVGATDYRSRTPAAFSSRGPVAFGNDTRDGVDLIGPGTRVLSTLPGDTYGNLSGTSMATPHVSGTIALLIGADADRSQLDIERILRNTTDGSSAPSHVVGDGTVNAWRAVRNASLTTLSGRVFENESTAAANATIVIVQDGGPIYPPRETNTTGEFDSFVRIGIAHTLRYYQSPPTSVIAVTATEERFPRDGSVDIFALGRLNISNQTLVNDTIVPDGHVLNVTVTGEWNRSIRNATVRVLHRNASATAPLTLPNATDSSGRLVLADGRKPGIELNGNVTVSVIPPPHADWLLNTTSVHNLTVSNDTRLTIRLPGNDSTSPTIRDPVAVDATDGDGTVQDGDTIDLSVRVIDNGSGVQWVIANASIFGAGTAVLTDTDDDGNYTGSVTVDESRAAETGSAYTVTFVANDSADNVAFGQSNGLTLGQVTTVSGGQPGFGGAAALIAFVITIMAARGRL